MKRGGGGVWVGPTEGHLFKIDFPSAKFFVKNFFGGWVSEPRLAITLVLPQGVGGSCTRPWQY